MNTTDQPRYAVRRVDHPVLGPQWTVFVPNARLDPVSPRYSPDQPALIPGGRTYSFGRGPAAFEEARDAVFGPLAIDAARPDLPADEEQPRAFDGTRNWLAGKIPPTTQTFTITDPDAVRAIAALFDDDQQPAPATREEFVQAVADGVERALEARDERIRAAHHARIDAYVLRAMAEDDGIEELNAQGIYPPTGPEPARVIPGVDPRQRTATIHDRDCDEWTWDFAEGTWVQTATGTRSQWRGEAMLERGPFHAHRTA